MEMVVRVVRVAVRKEDGMGVRDTDGERGR